MLEKLPLETFQTFSDLFDDGVYAAIDLTNCVTRRVSYGGTSVPSVEAQIAWVDAAARVHKHIRIFFTGPAFPKWRAPVLHCHKKILYNKQKVVQKVLPFPGWG